MAVPADKIVLASALVTFTSTVAAEMLPPSVGGKGELPPPKLLFGTGLTFAGLSMAADIAPSFIGPLAAAIGMTALTWYGMPLIDNWFNHKHNVVTRKGK